LLLLGTNDLILGSTAPQTLTNLGALLDHIHARRPTAKILLGNNPGLRVNWEYPDITPQEVSDFNAGVPALVNSRAAQGWNIALVDLYGQAGLNRTSSSTDYSPDGLHLSLTGSGREVLEGREDWVHLHGIDRWLGGVHLHGREAAWRWDGERSRLVPAAIPE
jgi:lysophospholipase L1-like esterase